MRKYFCLFIVATLIILTQSACRTDEENTNKYTLVQENGNCYIIMDPVQVDPPNCNPVVALYFESMDEMVSDFTNGNFLLAELEILQLFKKTDDGAIIIPNLGALKEPILPDDFGKYKIIATGAKYTYLYSDPTFAERIRFVFTDEQNYNEQVEEFLNYEEELAGKEQLNITDVSDRNATVYTWIEKEMLCEDILYSIEANGTVYYILESYEDQKIVYLNLWFSNEGTYVDVTIHAPAERPGVEWISSFAVKPYEN